MRPAETTVLIVDDDTTVAHIYTLWLERVGYRVVVAVDGADGLEKAGRELPDLIFLDVSLPRMDGVAALRALAGDPATKDVPVVMLSNFDDPAVMRESMRLGAKEYVVKAGTSPAELGALVARWAQAG